MHYNINIHLNTDMLFFKFGLLFSLHEVIQIFYTCMFTHNTDNKKVFRGEIVGYP